MKSNAFVYDCCRRGMTCCCAGTQRCSVVSTKCEFQWRGSGLRISFSTTSLSLFFLHALTNNIISRLSFRWCSRDGSRSGQPAPVAGRVGSESFDHGKFRKIRQFLVSEQNSCPRISAAKDLQTSTLPTLLFYVDLIDVYERNTYCTIFVHAAIFYFGMTVSDLNLVNFAGHLAGQEPVDD